MIRHTRSLTLVLVALATLSRSAIGDDGNTPSLVAPHGIVRLSGGSLLISDIETHRILKLERSGELSFWGGTGQADFSGDGKHISRAAFNAPSDLKLSPEGHAVYIADSNNHRIRKVDLNTLVVTTIAGNGSAELSGDGGPAIKCGLNNPQGIAVGHSGIMIADTYNHVVREINTEGIITTVAGTTAGLSGDGGSARAAQLSLPMAVDFDTTRRGFLVSDFGNSRIRRVVPDGTIETVCGIGKGSDDAGAGFAGDGELATKAKIFSPFDVAVYSENMFYFSDSGNHRIRAVVHGVVVSLVGSGHPSGPNQPKESDKLLDKKEQADSRPTLSVPAKITIAPEGLYFCDRGNRSIRLLKKDGKIKTLTVRPVTTNVPSESNLGQELKVDAK